MPMLGDYFSKKVIHSQICAGRFLYLHCDFTIPPKEKHLVVCYQEEAEVCFFVINSSINEFIRRNIALLECQVEIACSEYSFLDHNSYINCAEIIKLTLEDTLSQLEGNISRIHGITNENTTGEIIRAVERSKTLSVNEKIKIIAALKHAQNK